MAVTKRTRFEVLRRDNHTCRYCGAAAPDVKLHVDHVTPVALGGTDGPDNLVAACIDCNFGKSSSSPDANIVADVTADAVRWALIMKVAAEVIEEEAAAKRSAMNTLRRLFISEYWGDEYIPLPNDWLETTYRFTTNGLSVETLCEFAGIAITKPTVLRTNAFRYFCGIAWNRVREQQELAKELFEHDRKATK
jgi:hypothetical protein